MYKARKSSLIGSYYSYIYPYFTYCLKSWDCASTTQLNPLFLLKKMIRIMTFSNYLAHTEPIFNALHILPFHKLFLYSTGICMYKYSKNCLPLIYLYVSCMLKTVLYISTTLETVKP